MIQRKSLVILDLDNTLWDWLAVWHSSFSAMLSNLVGASGISQGVLEADFKAVHERHRTSEYAFSIEELASLRAKHPGENLVTLYDGAIQAFRTARTTSLALYPTVLETLETLKDRGCLLVGYTE
ncbi:MAG: HAD family hydrolase, partial [bacterium]